jgi:hypothetical protein
MKNKIINDYVRIQFDNLTIGIDIGNYIYEVDLERLSMKEWLDHLKEKNWYSFEIEQGVIDAYSWLKESKRYSKKVSF